MEILVKPERPLRRNEGIDAMKTQPVGCEVNAAMYSAQVGAYCGKFLPRMTSSRRFGRLLRTPFKWFQSGDILVSVTILFRQV